MKIKCFSKRKLNVRISKTKIKCAILGFSQNCCILGKSREKLVKFSKNSAKIQQILANFATFCKNQQKNSAIFNEKIEIRERCKGRQTELQVCSAYSSFIFARIGRSDLTRKLEKVGPFECDELEKHRSLISIFSSKIAKKICD